MYTLRVIYSDGRSRVGLFPYETLHAAFEEIKDLFTIPTVVCVEIHTHNRIETVVVK